MARGQGPVRRARASLRALEDAGELDADLELLDPLLEASRDLAPLPAETPNVDALDEFLVRMRKARF